MKKTKATEQMLTGTRHGKPSNPGMSVMDSHPGAIPYRSDPEFHIHPAPTPLPGPGLDLSPQEREIVRRLLCRWRLQPSLPRAMLVGYLPKGVRLTRGQDQLLNSLGSQAWLGVTSDVEALWSLDYCQAPPTIDQFVDGDYYLGASLRRTVGNEGLWPEWRNWLVENASLGSFLHELVITGALGTGKTLVTVTLLLYRICLCGLLRDPYAFFGLSRGSSIVFLLLSISMNTLRATAWLTALRLLGASPFFCEFCGFDATKMHGEAEVLLRINAGTPKEFEITLSGGSKSQHQIGRNVLGVGLDESNFRLEKDPQEYACQLFEDLRTRMVSRFQRFGTFMPGLSVVASSAAGESCFTEQRRQEIEKEGDPNGQLVVRQAIYRIKPGLKLCSWRFRVCYGLQNVEPGILKGCYDESDQPIAPPTDCPAELAASHEPVPQGAQLEFVPGDFYDSFVRSPRKGLQQLSGISLGAANRLFPTLADIHRCLDLSVQEHVPVPTRASIISVSAEDRREICEDLDHKAFVRGIGQDRYEPVRHPQRLRYVHLDLATRGLAGLAICHLADPPLAQVIQESLVTSSLRLVIEYDFILTLAPGKTRPIYFDKIVDFICWLRDPCGFRFGLITADSFQSEHMRQTLQAMGFKTDLQSVDRDKRAYLAWQGGFQEGCIRLYRQDQLLKEAAELVELDAKIDHPPNGGSKDTTDAAAGAFLNAISSDEIRKLSSPQALPVVVGISPFANASPQDPFGFYTRVPKRTPKVFNC